MSTQEKMMGNWNHLKGNSLKGRRVVYVHLPVPPGVSDTHQAVASKSKSKKTLHTASSKSAAPSAVHHTVKSGETLYSIAQSYNVTVTSLKHDNGDPAVLRPGMVLLIPEAR